MLPMMHYHPVVCTIVRSSLLLICLAVLLSCNTEYKPLELKNRYKVQGSGLIGIAAAEDGYYISDGANSRILVADGNFRVIDSIVGLERPMHIEYKDGALLVPNYGSDVILSIDMETRENKELQTSAQFDAPSGIALSSMHGLAVADFYNHQVQLIKGDQVTILGQKGTEAGSFTYPTDVQFVGDYLYVADAYNNRGQRIDLSADPIAYMAFGEAEKYNAAIGIAVTERLVALTDQENGRVHVYDAATLELIQTLDLTGHKPIEVLWEDDALLVLLFDTGEVLRYSPR